MEQGSVQSPLTFNGLDVWECPGAVCYSYKRLLGTQGESLRNQLKVCVFVIRQPTFYLLTDRTWDSSDAMPLRLNRACWLALGFPDISRSSRLIGWHWLTERGRRLHGDAGGNYLSWCSFSDVPGTPTPMDRFLTNIPPLNYLSSLEFLVRFPLSSWCLSGIFSSTDFIPGEEVMKQRWSWEEGGEGVLKAD